MTDFTFTESAPCEHRNRVDAQYVAAVDVFALTDKGAAFVATEYRPLYDEPLKSSSRTHNIHAHWAKTRFCQSDGKYYLSYIDTPLAYESPLDFLTHVESKPYTFRRMTFTDMFIRCRKGDAPCVIFHGNLNEVSAAFEFYIYDTDTLTAVIDATNRILARDGKAGWEYRDGEVRRAEYVSDN